VATTQKTAATALEILGGKWQHPGKVGKNEDCHHTLVICQRVATSLRTSGKFAGSLPPLAGHFAIFFVDCFQEMSKRLG
jgi:hypothetical protein